MEKITKEEVVEQVNAVKETVKKNAGKAAASAKKATAKTVDEAGKAAATAKKRIAKEYAKLALSDCYIQYAGSEYSQAAILEKVEAAYVADGHRLSSMRELKLYVKPEDGAAYYVINGKYAGSVAL